MNITEEEAKEYLLDTYLSTNKFNGNESLYSEIKEGYTFTKGFINYGRGLEIAYYNNSDNTDEVKIIRTLYKGKDRMVLDIDEYNNDTLYSYHADSNGYYSENSNDNYVYSKTAIPTDLEDDYYKYAYKFVPNGVVVYKLVGCLQLTPDATTYAPLIDEYTNSRYYLYTKEPMYMDGWVLDEDKLNELKSNIYDYYKNKKISELSEKCENLIYKGVDIKDKHYSLTLNDQTNITNLYILSTNNDNEEALIYHADDEDDRTFSKDEVTELYLDMIEFIRTLTASFRDAKKEILELKYLDKIKDYEWNYNLVTFINN